MTTTPNPLTPSELAYHALHPKLSLAQVYYVYTHTTLDGRIVYVGKGKNRRAWEFTRRDSAHKAWLSEQRHIDYVINHLAEANFDPEFYSHYEAEIRSTFSNQFQTV